MKYINFKRYKFSTITKSIDAIKDNLLKLAKYASSKKYEVKKLYKYLNITKFDFTKYRKYFYLKNYNFNQFKKINFLSSKYLFIHLPLAVIFFGFLYLAIPTLYTYDKSSIQNTICSNKNIECLINGKINYKFYPTPRIKIKDFIVKEKKTKNKTFLRVADVSVKLSIKNLLAKEKHKIKKIELNNFEVNLNIEDYKKYIGALEKNLNFFPINFKKGNILFYENNEYVVSINDAKVKTNFFNNYIKSEIKGKFLNDSIYINFDSKKDNDSGKTSTDIIVKMSNLNFLTKANISSQKKEKNIKNGNFLIKKGKNKITGIFNYNDNKLNINKSNIKNSFIEGELEGNLIFSPYFNFNLDANLNSINFTKLYNYFLSLDDDSKKNLFKVNKKINGNLNLSSNKVYSGYDLVKSFESRLKFNNGDILIEQFLLNLGKLGAADVLGAIQNDKKFTNFIFESNIFVDNEKKFLSKFKIHKKKSISSNLFISGNIDLKNLRATFYEISDDKKLAQDDVNFIENEFNELMLDEGYKSLFKFSKFKEFVKSITSELI